MSNPVPESGDRPADELDEIEITPEMIEAGLVAFYDNSPEFNSPDKTFSAVYLAMTMVKRKALALSA